MRALAIGTLGLLVGFGGMPANAAHEPHFATGLPACYSKSSPILDSHYGYDDRNCAKAIEGRATYESGKAASRRG